MLRCAFRNLAVVFAAVVGLAVASPSSATPLGLVLEPEPDIFSDFLSVTYDAVGDLLTVTGFAETLATGGGSETIVGGGYSLTAIVDGSGILSGGTISVTGTVPTLGFGSGTLLTGTLTAIGFPLSPGPLEFLFDVTGGDAAGLYTPAGFTGATIIGAPNGFPGHWGSSFSVGFASVSDTGIVVPEPSMLFLLAPGLLALGLVRRRNN